MSSRRSALKVGDYVFLGDFIGTITSVSKRRGKKGRLYYFKPLDPTRMFPRFAWRVELRKATKAEETIWRLSGGRS